MRRPPLHKLKLKHKNKRGTCKGYQMQQDVLRVCIIYGTRVRVSFEIFEEVRPAGREFVLWDRREKIAKTYQVDILYT